MKQTICYLLALALFVCAFAGCGKEDQSKPLFAERGETERAALGELYPAANAETVLSALAEAGQRQAERWEPEDAGARDQGPRLALSPADAVGDSVATDGGFLYMLDSYGLVVCSAAGERSEMLSYTRVPRNGESWSERLYLGEDRVAVLCAVSGSDQDETGLRLDAPEVQLTIFDCADKRAPKQLSTLTVEGELVDACLIDGTLCLVTEKRLLALPDEKAEELLPVIRENGKELPLRAGEIYLCPEPAKAALTLVSAVRLEDGRLADALAFTDGTEAVCRDGSSLCLARTRWAETASAPYREEPYTVVDYSATAQTEIKRVSLDGGLRLDGGCVLQGALCDPTALTLRSGRLLAGLSTDSRSFSAYTDEAHGWTNYEGRSHETGNRLAVLDQTLREAEPILLKDVSDCRFLGDGAWLTLAGEPDRVYALSLAAGESELHSVSLPGADSLLLREFGQDKALVLRVPGGGKAELSLYDLSEPGAPKELSSLTLRQGAPAGDLSARGALLADPETGLIGWPAEGEDGVEYRLIRWTGSKLQDQGAFALEYVPVNARGLALHGLLYICSPGAVYVTDPETRTVIASVSNAVG